MAWRVVFDTNIMISGLLWRGKPYSCLQLARSRVVEACYCRQMLDELAGKLQRKFGFSKERVTAILEDWRSKTVEVTVSGKDRFVTADPGDDIFIECAITAGAETIVSGDRHLKDLGQCSGISILSAAEFLERVLARTEE